ncbi:MAG: tripartite tricarboxylate transporter substrate binding protein [Candidatus Parcubacteria bacterium]|nr:tripartite tricarboxylate transporter substrate binding protein [Burkholderiales bacterium]
MKTILAIVAVLFSASVSAQYPARPVKVVIPFPPGGPTDVVGRLLAQKLTEQTGQNFLIENRAGGNATIGSNEVAKSAADGYTLLFNASIFSITPFLSKTVPYDVQKDFTTIALVAKGPLAVAVSSSVPANNLKELIAHAKGNPGKLAFAIGSVGSAGHLGTELLKRSAGIELLIVPYKGSTPAYQDLLGGQIQGFLDPVLGAQPHWKSGKIKVLAVTSLKRLPSAQETPAAAETLPGYEFYTWYGLWGPAGLPRDILARLNVEVNKALGSDLREKLLAQGYELSPGSPEDFAKFQREDMARSGKIILDAGIKVE